MASSTLRSWHLYWTKTKNRHVPCATPKMRLRPIPGNVSSGCKWYPISVKGNLKIEADQVVCVAYILYATESLIKFYVIIFYRAAWNADAV